MKKILAFGTSNSKSSINQKLVTWSANQVDDVIYIGNVIDGDQLQFRMIIDYFEGRSADPAHSIDCNSFQSLLLSF